MKNLILIISILLAVSCGKGKEAQTKTKAAEDNNTKPIKVDENATKLTAEEQKIIGEYTPELKSEFYMAFNGRLVLLDNGIAEFHYGGRKDGKWKLSKEGKLHVTDPDGHIIVCSIDKDGSITLIAGMPKTKDFPKPIGYYPKFAPQTLKKIK